MSAWCLCLCASGAGACLPACVRFHAGLLLAWNKRRRDAGRHQREEVRAARLPLTLGPSRHVSPAGLLMRQIRGSDFLERNPATGPSLFDLAALHQDAGGEDMEVLMDASGAQPGSTDGMESVEDLARKLVLQVCLCHLSSIDMYKMLRMN